jgi:hypothetical protein
MKTTGSLDEHEQSPTESASAQVQATASTTPRKRSRYFAEWDREDRLQAFFAWLPRELHDAPGIDWTQLPPTVMGYCVNTIGKSPDRTHLAVAVASAFGAIKNHTLLHLVGHLHRFFQTLRSKCNMKQLSDLHNEPIWRDWLAQTARTETPRKQVKTYGALTTSHYPLYLQRLNARDRLRMQAYVLPPLPPDLLSTQFPHTAIKTAQQAKRKAQSDVLVPLYPVLRQIVRFRKQLAERTLQAIRQAHHKVETGEAELPFSFVHTDTIPEVNRDARTISEVQIYGREVTMHFTLWDKRTWTIHHKDRVRPRTVQAAQDAEGTYQQEHNLIFVQFKGKASDLFWFGDLVEHRLFQAFKKGEAGHEKEGNHDERWHMARSLGFSDGCHCVRPGLLNSSDQWLSDSAIHRNGDFVFETESLYRGILFGSALATIALSNGSRMSELLQVSWNKERRVTRTETVMLLDTDGHPCIGEDGKPTTKQVPIYLQHLLPKGAKTEEERQLFPLSREAMRLLSEIKNLLVETHGEIPIVSPPRSSPKYEDLKAERYLFQWAASPDGSVGILTVQDVQVLLRFMLHGLDFYTAQGNPIRVSAHVLRHVMATHARHYRHVPAEAIAYFFLHHRLKSLTGRTPSVAEISEYYFQMTEEQRFAVIRTDLDEQEEMDRAILQTAPTVRDLEQMNGDLQAVFELWHTLHPTALGNCGCPGLCPRGNDRALCLGCSYLVTDPDRLGAALAWRTSYAKQAELLEAQGNTIDARQARIKVQQLDDVITIMRLQAQAEAEGHYIPLHKVLPSSSRKAKKLHEEES